jgi:fatty acid/phospholipid biosynthesis enzyme
LGDVFTRLRHFADHETYGGTAVLGVTPPIVALRHDASSKAWENAMILASEWERVKLHGLIKETFAY